MDVGIFFVDAQGIGRCHLAHAIALSEEVDARQSLLCSRVLGIVEQQLLDHFDRLVVAAGLT